ncbi:MAG: helix-hairpin-helix domain-containing protein [Candidatus Thermoplasmatota archaeon]|nr:helix-hairpin-helix domain-containing protein [Candidatus Thermoplasmatota archaeon]
MKDKDSEENIVNKLRMILDKSSDVDLNSKEKKHLKSLIKRLKNEEEKELALRKISLDEEDDALKPKVIIHERKKKIDFRKTEKELKGNETLEVKKADVELLEFVEIKPKDIKKDETEENPVFIPVEEPEDDKVEDFEKEETEQIQKLDEIDGAKENIEEKMPEWIPAEEQDVEETVESKGDEPQIQEYEQESANILDESEDISYKLEPFRDMESIDDETAVLLYDNGFTSIEALTLASLKDLKKIKGLKKRIAKKIKNEIDEGTEWATAIDKDTDEYLESNMPTGEEPEKEETEPAKEMEELEIDKNTEQETTNIEEDISYKLEPFRDMESIDDETAVLLYDNGFISIDILELASVRDLKKIGIKKKLAKTMIKELNEKEDALGMKPVLDEEIEHEDLEIDDVEEEKGVDVNEKIETFKDMESIDDETAVLLYDNYITSISELKGVSYKDLIKIKKFKKKVAKGIIAELDKMQEESLKVKPIELGESAEGKVTKEQIEEVGELEEDENTPSPMELKTKSSEWRPSPKDEKEFEGDVELEDEKNIIDVFKDMESIDDETAVILYKYGFTSIDELMIASLKDLCNVKGIKRRLAKKIKKEIDEKGQWGPVAEENGIKKFLENEGEYFSIDKEVEKNNEKILEYEPGEIIDEGEFSEEQESMKDGDGSEFDAFEKINSIDEKTARLLVENGIMSVGDLIEQTVKNLTKIKGIKRKLAKEIKREVNSLIEMGKLEDEQNSFGRNENPFIEEGEDWETFDEEKTSDEEITETQGYTYREFTLYKREIETKGGKKRTVRFFSKETPNEGEPIALPTGYEVKVNKKTKVPYLKKKS